MARVYKCNVGTEILRFCLEARTLYLARSSFDKDEDMILRRMEEGAAKCALRDLRLEEETSNEAEFQYSAIFHFPAHHKGSSSPPKVHPAPNRPEIHGNLEERADWSRRAA